MEGQLPQAQNPGMSNYAIFKEGLLITSIVTITVGMVVAVRDLLEMRAERKKRDAA